MTEPSNDALQAPLIGIVRHRLSTDGEGVTTLVAFHGCPLRCRYCLNAQCLDPAKVWRHITPEQLLDEVAIDNLYFLATGGGVTFGGGEPLLRSEFIKTFALLMPKEWNITLETSLNVDRHHLAAVLPHTRQFIVDIKDTNPDIYHAYTTQEIRRTLDNLRWLLSQSDDMSQRVIVRLPHIPNFNTPADVDRSRQLLADMGVTQFDEFDYLPLRDE